MSNSNARGPEHVAIVNELTLVEMNAWLRLKQAELELESARRHVIDVTNREGSKRRTRRHLRVVRYEES